MVLGIAPYWAVLKHIHNSQADVMLNTAARVY